MREAIALALLVVVAGCPTTPDPRYCDDSHRCGEAVYRYCNSVKHECEAQPQDASASAPMDMTLAVDMEASGINEGGVAVDMTKIGCVDSSTCPASMPLCANNFCGSCAYGMADASSVCSQYHASTPLCAPNGQCGECLSASDCTDSTKPHCSPQYQCVQCLTKGDCADPMQPICGSGNLCRKCQAHSECTALVCEDSGACAAQSQIELIDNHGLSIANCNSSYPTQNGRTPATAYCDIQPVVSLAGISSYYLLVRGYGSAAPYSPVSLTGPNNAPSIIASRAPGAMTPVIAGTMGSTPVDALQLNGTATNPVIIDGVELTGSGKYGFECNNSGAIVASIRNTTIDVNSSGVYNNSGNLTLLNVVVDRNSFLGVTGQTTANSGTLTIVNSQITNNQTTGLSSYGASLTIDRSKINGNQNAILALSAGFTITNNVIAYNKGRIFLGTPPNSNTIFQFNTVANNTGVFAIDCSGHPTHVESSIIWGNGDGSQTTQISGNCALSNVVTGTDTYPGAITLNPAFVNPGVISPDFHLALDTPENIAANEACCIDKVHSTVDGGAPSLPDHDIDGTMRPQGSGWDIGAHEAK
jgi:hypothetical protein